jgi:choline dehydrogenase-like flavoprotein
MVDFDYVIVGAGAASCVLASRLSEVPGNEVLLEYGGPDANPLLYVPKGYYFTLRGNRCTCHAVGASATPPRRRRCRRPPAACPRRDRAARRRRCVLSVQVAGNTQAPKMAVAWTAADLILEDS